MAEYAVVFARSARWELEKLPNAISDRIIGKIAALTAEARPHGCRKIEGTDNLWRIRVGDYRIIYTVDDAQSLIDVVAVRHRRDAYR